METGADGKPTSMGASRLKPIPMGDRRRGDRDRGQAGFNGRQSQRISHYRNRRHTGFIRRQETCRQGQTANRLQSETEDVETGTSGKPASMGDRRRGESTRRGTDFNGKIGFQTP